ncbi:hypothetical protein ACFWDZ_31545 [Micromonospora aurantiaca]|uniref:hypothetical protein n=1 Tax=Micromonospora aurantiaca (nom. illeg.) TaxID=47850 RepID=UPI00364E93E5
MEIWEGESRFRHHLEVGARGALGAIGFEGEVRVALIGLPLGSAGAAVVFEGKDALERRGRTFGFIDLRELKSLDDRIINQKSGERPDYAFSCALDKLLNRRSSAWRYFLAPQSVVMGDSCVYSAIAVPSADFDRIPQLVNARSSGALAYSSLASHLIWQILYRSWLHLASDPDGPGIISLTTQKFEIIRTATAAFVAYSLDFSGLHSKRDSDMMLSAISALPYEGRAGQGVVAVVPPDPDKVLVRLRLEAPVPIERLHAVRKLMEVATEETNLLLHQAEIYGIGEILPSAHKLEPAPAYIKFEGRGAWTLAQGERNLLKVKDGTSRLPSEAEFDEIGITNRILWLLPGADVDALLRLARAARRNRHGAMLIISADAAEEAQRLAPQAWPVRPAEISDTMMAQLTEMDGGVLVDPQGRCHAIGVILDGVAAGEGDPGRGSRFNNPVRYLGTRQASTNGIPNAVVIVYSSDGVVDALPQYPGVKERALLEHLVTQLIYHAEAAVPDLSDLLVTLRHLRENQFYLSPVQCVVLNEALDRIALLATDLIGQESLLYRFEADPLLKFDLLLR